MKAWHKRIMTWLILLLSLYVVYCGLLFFFQTKLIFPASMAGQPGQGMPTGVTEQIELQTEQGRTVSWFAPAPGCSAENPKPVAVFFHGNAELIDHQRAIIDLYHARGVSVYMVEYRGYGNSDGTPSEANIVADTVALLSGLLKREDVDGENLILHGRSIGGGLATQVALQTEPKALIVENTFTSVSGMAIRYGVPPFIVTSPLKSEQAFTKLDVPILIMHGKDDSIVPVSHGHALAQAAKNATLVLFDSGHNNLPNGLEVQMYREAVSDHLDHAGVLSEQ